MYVIPKFMCLNESSRDAILGLQWLSPCQRPLALDRPFATLLSAKDGSNMFQEDGSFAAE
jgi:hypothetical protein